jgi:hypothetical protein
MLLLVALVMPACAAVTLDDPLDRGVQAYHDGRYEQALFEFDAAVGQNPTAAAFGNRGTALARLGALAAALADYDRAIELAPDDPVAYVNRGNAHVLAATYGRAIADFSRAIELSPRHARAYYNRSTARRLAGDPRWLDDVLAAAELETDPWEKARMRRRLDPGAALETSPLAASPATPPPTLLAPGSGSPAVAAPPAVSGQAGMDARVLATRGLSRAIDGDRAGAVADLRAALALEREPARRARIEALLNALLPSPR